MNRLNKLNTIKVLYCIHLSFFYKIYYEQLYRLEDTSYQRYKSCKFVLSLIPLENDYLFKKWGINSILMENPTTFEYYSNYTFRFISKKYYYDRKRRFPWKKI